MFTLAKHFSSLSPHRGDTIPHVHVHFLWRGGIRSEAPMIPTAALYPTLPSNINVAAAQGSVATKPGVTMGITGVRRRQSPGQGETLIQHLATVDIARCQVENIRSLVALILFSMVFSSFLKNRIICCTIRDKINVFPN